MTTGESTQIRTYPTALAFCITSFFWMGVATFMGLLGATFLIAPDLANNVSWMFFGRVRPVHVNMVLFGFVTPGLLAAAFYYLPKLLDTELYSEKLGVATVLLWNVVLVAAVGSLLAGHSQGREYAELIWPVESIFNHLNRLLLWVIRWLSGCLRILCKMAFIWRLAMWGQIVLRMQRVSR